MGGFRSSGTNTEGLRERHKYTLRQGPLDRIEQEEEEGAVRERESVAGLMCCRVVGRGFEQDDPQGQRGREVRWKRKIVIRKIRSNLIECRVGTRLLEIDTYDGA